MAESEKGWLYVDSSSRYSDVRGSDCVICKQGHSFKAWCRAYYLTNEGAKFASELHQHEIVAGYCCIKSYTRVKRYATNQLKRQKDNQDQENSIAKIRRQELATMTSIPFESMLEKWMKDPAQTSELLLHRTNHRAILKLKSNTENVSRKHRQKLVREKIIPISMCLLNCTAEEAINTIISVKNSKIAIEKSKWYNCKITKQSKMVKQFTAKKIQKRNQLMSGIATYGTGISLSTAKTMNIINAKQTNHEKLQNSHMKNPFSRIRKCMKTSILKDYICHAFDNRSLNSADLGKELLNIFKNKTNIEFNSLDNYDQILHALENQQKSTLNRDIPSILKYIYIEQKLLSFDSDRLFQAIEYFAGIVEVEKLNLWQKVADHLQISFKFSNDFCRLGYYYFKNEIPPIQIFQRRLIKLDDDLLMPTINEQEMKDDVEALCIGKATENDEDDSELYTMEEWCKVFENPLSVYIGYPITIPITLNGKDVAVKGVVRRIIPVITQHMIQCHKYGYIRQHVSNININLGIVDWMDGTCILNHSLVKVTVQFLWDENVFDTSGLNFVTKPLPIIYTWCPETKQNVATVSSVLRDQYFELKQFGFKYNNLNIKFQPRYMSADYSNAAKRWNHKVGGHYRCSKCDISFKNCEHIDYLQCIKLLTNNKSLENLLKTKNFSHGQEGLPHIINDGKHLTLEQRGLHQYENGSEILHVTKGISTGMFTMFKKEKYFKETECFAALDIHIRNNAHSSTLSNGDWRMIFCKFSETILPFIVQEKANAELLLLLWRDILRFMYNKKVHTLCENHQFCTKVFVFGCLVINRWGKAIVGLHLHDLWIHISQLVWKVNLYFLSAEKGEQSFSREKKIAKDTTDHKDETVIVQIIKRTMFEDVVRSNFKNSKTTRSSMEKLLENIPQIPSIIPKSISSDLKYCKWVKAFEDNILIPNFPAFEKFDYKGHSVHGENSPNLSPEFENILNNCLVTNSIIYRKKAKCPHCKKKFDNISPSCILACCNNCCDDEDCEYHINLPKETPLMIQSHSQTQTQMNSSQDNQCVSQAQPPQTNSSLPMRNNVSTTFTPKPVCTNSSKACTNKKVSAKCTNKMCKNCCLSHQACSYHNSSKTKQKKTTPSPKQSVPPQSTTLVGGSVMNKQ